MTSKCSIKKQKLPPIQRPATKPVRNDEYYTVGENGLLVRRTRELLEINLTPTHQTKKNAHEARSEKARERWKIILQMVKEDADTDEIAAATGYKPSTVQNIINKLRKEGHDIPQRTMGAGRRNLK